MRFVKCPTQEKFRICLILPETGCQKLREGTKGLWQKVWTRTKILSPNIRYFVATLRFVSILALFGRIWAKKVLLLVKNSVSWQEVHYYMVHIAYYAEINLQICNYARK